jgi:hypothetical protein
MAASQFTVTLGVQFTPPSAPANSGVSTFGAQGNYNAQNVGAIDVPTTVVPPTDFAIPFGSVSAASMALVKNLTSNAIGLKLNGSLTVNYDLAPGAIWMMAGATASTGVGSTPLTAISATVTVAPTIVEAVQYMVFGD